MRRTPLALALATTLALTACGGDDDDASSATTTEVTGTAATDPTERTDTTETSSGSIPEVSLVPVTSVPVSVPEVVVPDEIPSELVVTQITPGSGDEAADGDTVYVRYVGVRSEDGEQFDTNYGGEPFPVTLGAGSVIQGWDQGLVGATTGERLQLDIPSELAYGDQPQGDVIRAGDALTFVIDVLAVAPATDPADAPVTADLPLSSELVEASTVEDLRDGDGATLEEGQTAVAHLFVARADDGTELQSSWLGAPQLVPVIADQLIPELVDGLAGMRVGGRRLVRVPSNADMGLTPETDIFVVVDLLAVVDAD